MTLLEELIAERVRLSIGATLSRAAERTAEKLAAGIVADAAFKERFHAMVVVWTEQAMSELMAPTKPTSRTRKRSSRK